MLQHLPDMIALHGPLACFTLERKHKSIKEWMNSYHVVGNGWDKSILECVVEKQWWRISETSLLKFGLRSRTELKTSDKFYKLFNLPHGMLVHHSCTCCLRGGESVGVDDIVFCVGSGSYYCAKIVHFFQMTMLASQDVLALVQMYEFVEEDSFDGRVSVHRRSETRACVAVECIHAVAACCLPQSADALRVVSPAWLSAKDGFTFS